jgi:oligopeptide transport system substrate-binding protein
VFRTVDPDAAYVGFQQGRIDVAAVPAGALDQARRTYGDAVSGVGPGVVDDFEPALYFLGLRTDEPPWENVELRRALSRAIDRRAIVDGEPDQQLDVARSIVSPSLPGAGHVFCDSCLFLPSLARDAFERAGVSEITLTYDADGGHEQIVQRLQRDLAEVGVTLVTRALPFDEYLAALEAGELPLYRFGWQAQYPSAGAMLVPLVHSGTPREAGDGANYGRYASPEVDRLLDRARMTESAEERQALWAQAEAIALREQAIVPLFTFRLRSVISERVENLTLTPWGTATPEQARVVAEPNIQD